MVSKLLKVHNKTEESIPSIPFDEIARAALGPKYDLSVVFVSSEEIKRLNQQYREKNSPTDILSFPLSEDQGEIYICLEETRKQAKDFDRNYENFLAFLFIHGCVHLKGYDHGSTMENIEAELRVKFGV